MTTTATKPAPQAPPAPPAAEYPFPYSKGAYVARIDGPHGRYGLDRDFEGVEYKTRNKARGRVVYLLRPGWYEAQDKPGRRWVIAVDSHGLEHRLDHPGTSKDALRPLGKAARRGETIDQPGAYAGRTCWCSEPATAWQPADGRARCADHYRPPAQDGPPDPTEPPEPDDECDPPDEIPTEWLEEVTR